MFRKATAAALVLSAVPAVLAMTFLVGTAQADDTRRGDGLGGDARWTQIAADADTPWGAITSNDTPWTAVTFGDTPWS